MATTTFYGNLVDYNVMPTENDHCGSGFGGEGSGRIPQELTLVPLLWGLGGSAGFVVSGFVMPSSGTLGSGKINANITAGVASILGYRIAGTSVVNADFTISTTNYVFLKLEKDLQGRLYRPVIHVDDAAFTIPDYAIALGSVTCNATVITSTEDFRYSNRLLTGRMTTTGGALSFDHRGTGDWSAVKSSGDVTVTFKTAFLRVPIIFYIRGSDHLVSAPATMSASSFVIPNVADADDLIFIVLG